MASSVDYALDAAQLLDAACRRLCMMFEIPEITPTSESSGKRISSFHEPNLLFLRHTLETIQDSIKYHLKSLLKECEAQNTYSQCFDDHRHQQNHYNQEGLMYMATKLQIYTRENMMSETFTSSLDNEHVTDDAENNLNSLTTIQFTAKMSLLFQLIYLLQFCLQRIEEADAVFNRDFIGAVSRSENLVEYLCEHEFVLSRRLFRGNLMHADGRGITITSSDNHQHPSSKHYTYSEKERRAARSLQFAKKLYIIGTLSVFASTVTFMCVPKENRKELNKNLKTCAFPLLSKGIIMFAVLRSTKRALTRVWMRARIQDIADDLAHWAERWKSILGATQDSDVKALVASENLVSEPSTEDHKTLFKSASSRLLECLPLITTKSSMSLQKIYKPYYWYSPGAFRFLLVRKAMNLIYASIGTALEFTGAEGSFGMWVPVAAAAASYYSIAASASGSQMRRFTSAASSKSTRTTLLQKSWGVVSLPVVKKLSLDLSTTLKRAAIASKISLCGVPCFIFSADQCPELSVALKRYNRQQNRKVSHLSTIDEQCRGVDKQPLRRRYSKVSESVCKRKNIILHLTGGGWFAHTISGDIPYLIDWSRATSSVVICPEYSLLPEHKFPHALNEVTEIYTSLVTGDCESLLGIQTDKIIISGESSGGNLAAGLCVKLLSDPSIMMDVERLLMERTVEKLVSLYKTPDNCNCFDVRKDIAEMIYRLDRKNGESVKNSSNSIIRPRLPDGLLLCCPALNLSCSSTFLEEQNDNENVDPILPSGLFQAITDAYLSVDGYSYTDPIASPYFASDFILNLFPPCLIYSTTNDPFLHDSIYFNTRLRRLNVNSDLRMAHNLPHAFWGLVTAPGFTEAAQVHQECQEWLNERFQSIPIHEAAMATGQWTSTCVANILSADDDKK